MPMMRVALLFSQRPAVARCTDDDTPPAPLAGNRGRPLPSWPASATASLFPAPCDGPRCTHPSRIEPRMESARFVPPPAALSRSNNSSCRLRLPWVNPRAAPSPLPSRDFLRRGVEPDRLAATGRAEIPKPRRCFERRTTEPARPLPRHEQRIGRFR